MRTLIGTKITFVPGAANINKGFYRNDGKGRWQGKIITKPYWRIHFVHADYGVFFPKHSVENHSLSFDRRYKAENVAKDESFWVAQDGYLYDTSGRWWIVQRSEVIAELGMPPREGRNLFMWERSPNITYPDDSFWLVDHMNNRYEFGMADDALLFAVRNKHLFEADHA